MLIWKDTARFVRGLISRNHTMLAVAVGKEMHGLHYIYLAKNSTNYKVGNSRHLDFQKY
jgi:hypothetical protein